MKLKQLFAITAIAAASGFLSSLQPVKTRADVIAVITKSCFNFIGFPSCLS